MRFLAIIFSTVILTACGTSKNVSNDRNKAEETNQSEQETSKPTKNYRVIGVVREKSKGCGICIETEVEPGIMKFLLPLNLDDSFLQEGTKIKFEYAINRKTKPPGCEADFVVKVYDVTRMR